MTHKHAHFLQMKQVTSNEDVDNFKHQLLTQICMPFPWWGSRTKILLPDTPLPFHNGLRVIHVKLYQKIVSDFGYIFV